MREPSAEKYSRSVRTSTDVALVAALVYSQKLQSKAGCELAELVGAQTPEYAAPASVASDSIVRATSSSVASVTGGVLINPWETIANNKVDTKLDGFSVEFSGSNFYAD